MPKKHKMASDSSNVDAPSPEEEVKEENVKCFRLFNCDQTYKFDAVEKLLEVIKAKLSFEISIQEHYFDLRNMSEVCDRINKKELQMDFAIFVVHAHESRLSINEENAGIGYAKLYRALLQAMEERVLIVIGGDDNYKDSAEEQSTVLSRWARRKVSSQFNDEFLDGRKSFIFSWDNEHRPIHEEAMLHFFDPDKKGEKFVPKPIVEATVPAKNPKTVKSHERGETDVKATKTKQNSSNIQPQTSEDTKHKMESDSSNFDVPSPEEEVKEENVKCFRLFNCDQTYKFDAVEKLLEGIKAKLSFDISIQEHYFDLRNMSEVCDRINKKDLQMDFAIFVVHAHESRLSINEDNAGIGYAKLYRALLQATEERVLIVIGGDDNYKDSAEEQSTVLSRWARRKVSSQFNDEFLDGRKSFIFSWDNEHRPIHEEAMLHFFDPDKKGEKFVPKPIVEATVPAKNPKKVESQERGETDVKSTKTKENSCNIQTQTSAAQKAQTSVEQDTTSLLNPPQMDNTDDGFEIVPSSHEEHGTEEHVDESEHIETSEHMEMSDETFEELSLEDVPKEGTSTQPDTGSSSLPEKIAILYRDKSDIATVKDVFGDVFGDVLQAAIITSSDPSGLKDFLLTESVRSCFIMVDARKMKEELNKKSHSIPYRDLLKAAGRTVEKKVVVILCKKGSDISSSEHDTITARIGELLGVKGFILWWEGNKSCLQSKRPSLSGSESCPVYDGAAKKSAKKESPTQVESPMTPEELVLHTRLRNGTISYEKSDVKLRLKGWTAPQEMANNLFKNNQYIANAELLVYRKIKTGNERTVVTEDIKSQWSGLSHSVKGAVDSVVGTSVVETGVAGVYGIGSTIGSTIKSTIRSTIGLCGSSNTPPNSDTPPSNSDTPPSNNSDTPPPNDESNDLQLD